jgi:hypothetical protein
LPRNKIRIGDVFAIPLPNENYAFGRLFKENCIAIYHHVGVSKKDIPTTEEYQFIVGVYLDVLTSGKWTVIDNRPFKTDDEAWPLPMCVIDSISGKYSIYHKGEFFNSSKEKCKDLEVAAVWDENHLIDRIMGDDKWNITI